MSVGTLVPDARQRFTIGAALLAAALFTLPTLFPGFAAAQVLLVGIVFMVLAGVFVSRPESLAYALIASVAVGGVELDLGGTMPKVFFATVTLCAYVASVSIRGALTVPARVTGETDAADHLVPARAISLLLVFYVVSLAPSLTKMQELDRSMYLLAMRTITLTGIILVARERRITTSESTVKLVVALVGCVIALSYLVKAAAIYRATSLPALVSGLALKDNTVRVGVLGTTNTIGSYLALTLPITMAYLTSARRGTSARTVAIAAVLIQAFGLLGTFSRGAVIAVVGAVIVAALVCHTSIAQLRRLLTFLAATAALVVVVLFLARDRMMEAFGSRFAAFTLFDYLFRRLELWRSSWEAFTARPLTGIGIGNVGFYDRDFGTGAGSESHNLVLQVLAEEGIVAAVLLFSALFLILRANVRRAKAGGSAPLWIVVALFSVLINAMIEPTFWQPAFAALFWFLAVYFTRVADGVARQNTA